MVPGNYALVPIFKGEYMALSLKAKKRLEVAMARRTEALEVIAAIDSNGSGPAAAVAAIGATSNLPASNLVAAIPAEPTKAEVDAGIDTLRVAAEARLDVIEAKIDAVIAALKAAGMMAP